jgi:hypothetical protein
MGIAYACSSKRRKLTALAAGALLLSSLSLGGCATSSTAGSSLMDARAEMPPPSKPGVYLPVEDLPQRPSSAMTPDERSKLLKELIAARDRQAEAVKAQGGPLEPMKPPG